MSSPPDSESGPEKLIIWHRSLDLMAECYRLSDRLPRRERFGLCAQVERASTSIPANIAEGYGRAKPKEFLHFLSMVRGSLREVETYFAIFERLGYFKPADLEQGRALATELSKMLLGLRRSVEKRL